MMIAGEISMAISFPHIIKSRQQCSEEIARQRLLALSDQLRNHCQESLKSYENDIDRETSQLIISQLDDLTLYFRANADRLHTSQLREFEEYLQYFMTIMDKLDNRTLYPFEVTINSKKYIQMILDDHPPK
jgi:hypothetical protein